MYMIRVRHADGFAFKVLCETVAEARLVGTELKKRFPSFEGYAVGACRIEESVKAVCL